MADQTTADPPASLSPLNLELQRRDFESWCLHRWPQCPDLLAVRPGDAGPDAEYLLPSTQIAWIAWMASQARFMADLSKNFQEIAQLLSVDVGAPNRSAPQGLVLQVFRRVIAERDELAIAAMGDFLEATSGDDGRNEA